MRRCLQSLQQQSCADFEVIVVDDGSHPPLKEGLPPTLANWSRLIWFRHAHNQGRASARNTGWHTARGEWVIFLDADMAVAPDFVQQHQHFHLRQGPGWIGQGQIIGTQHLHARPTPSIWTDASQAVFATGNVSIAQRALVQSGGFDTDFIEYGWEDLELGFRLQQLGYRAGRAQAQAWHYEPLPDWCAESLRAARQKAEATGRGAALFLRKHPYWTVRWMTQLSWAQGWLDTALLGGQRDQLWLSWAQRAAKSQPQFGLALYRLVLNHYALQSAWRAWRDQ